MRRSGSILTASFVAISSMVLNIVPAQAFILPASFYTFAASPTLASPGIIIIDPTTDETIFSVDPDVRRAPASVLKLFSMATVLNTFSPDLTFKTSISETNTPGTFLMVGEGDPWLTASPFEASKYQRAFSPTLIDKVMQLHPELRTITLEYNNVYALDINILQHYFAGRLTINAVKVNSIEDGVSQIASIESPMLAKIVEFTLLYSDNVLADRLARTAAHALGYSTDATGIQAAFVKTLADLNIPSTGLLVQDGNGLSHQTRVSVRQIADLLLAIRSNPKFKVIEDGLPIAGKTGTLKTRFVTDAPSAIGLVQAKTGWINTTVSLAGFVTVGANQYVFAIVANHIRNLESARQAARVTIDQMLATIARPQG
jgi:D-alanyl-D-alanine carboxypeptidase/D-alanyl-D-alanine-endopeptidase (penicillin-binding protein 4)